MKKMKLLNYASFLTFSSKFQLHCLCFSFLRCLKLLNGVWCSFSDDVNHCKNLEFKTCFYFIVNNTMHELYFDQVVIFWIKYNEAPTELDCTVINIIINKTVAESAFSFRVCF